MVGPRLGKTKCSRVGVQPEVAPTITQSVVSSFNYLITCRHETTQFLEPMTDRGGSGMTYRVRFNPPG